MRCKVSCKSVKMFKDGAEVVFNPVIGGLSQENDKFFKYTAYGEIKLGLINKELAGSLEPGKEYYVDFSPSE